MNMLPSILIRQLQDCNINRNLFVNFIRHQVVNDCYRKENGQWVVKSEPFIDDWTETDYAFLISCLKNTLRNGGVVYGAFIDNQLKGFVSVEGQLFDENSRYLDLTSLHISEDVRRLGIGRDLFQVAKKWAKARGANKLYISAHSAVESQKFYLAMGCRDAAKPNMEHVQAEPYDRQMECIL